MQVKEQTFVPREEYNSQLFSLLHDTTLHNQATNVVQPSLHSLPPGKNNGRRDGVNILIVYGPDDNPWQRELAMSIQEGCQSVSLSSPFTARVYIKSIAHAIFEDVLAAHAIILGSAVQNANTHPAVQQWIDTTWNLRQLRSSSSNNVKVGGAFVTAGGISAGQEGTLHSLLQTMMIFGLVTVGGETWESAFGVAAITGEPPFTLFQETGAADRLEDNDGNAFFPKSCYLKPGELISPLFLERARGLGARVTKVAH